MTAVEFLLRELGNKFPKEVQDLYYNNKEEFASICSKAKEMEKQQIIEAILFSEKEHIVQSDCYPPQFIVDKAEYYYNETFKKQVK